MPDEDTLTKKGVDLATAPLFTGGCSFINYATYIGFEDTLYVITKDGVFEAAPVGEGCEHLLHVDEETDISVTFIASRTKLRTIANTNSPHVKKEVRQAGTQASHGNGNRSSQFGFAGNPNGNSRYSGASRTGVARGYSRNLHGEEAEVGGHYEDIVPPVLDDII